jgi:hypothetical protein
MIPKQYEEKARPLIHEIGKLTDKLWFIVSETGDSLEIECRECVVIIKRKPSNP